MLRCSSSLFMSGRPGIPGQIDLNVLAWLTVEDQLIDSDHALEAKILPFFCQSLGIQSAFTSRLRFLVVRFRLVPVEVQAAGMESESQIGRSEASYLDPTTELGLVDMPSNGLDDQLATDTFKVQLKRRRPQGGIVRRTVASTEPGPNSQRIELGNGKLSSQLRFRPEIARPE